jgi:hypothetical protein
MKQEDIKRVWETLSYIVFPIKFLALVDGLEFANWFSENTGLKPTETSTYSTSKKMDLIEGSKNGSPVFLKQS